jgi:hypothetical protein
MMLCDGADDADDACAADDTHLRLDPVAAACIDEPLDATASPLVEFRGILREEVDSTMDICVVVKITLRDLFDDRQRFLRGGSIVEIDQRTTVDLTVQDGEIFAIH